MIEISLVNFSSAALHLQGHAFMSLSTSLFNVTLDQSSIFTCKSMIPRSAQTSYSPVPHILRAHCLFLYLALCGMTLMVNSLTMLDVMSAPPCLPGLTGGNRPRSPSVARELAVSV